MKSVKYTAKSENEKSIKEKYSELVKQYETYAKETDTKIAMLKEVNSILIDQYNELMSINCIDEQAKLIEFPLDDAVTITNFTNYRAEWVNIMTLYTISVRCSYNIFMEHLNDRYTISRIRDVPMTSFKCLKRDNGISGNSDLLERNAESQKRNRLLRKLYDLCDYNPSYLNYLDDEDSNDGWDAWEHKIMPPCREYMVTLKCLNSDHDDEDDLEEEPREDEFVENPFKDFLNKNKSKNDKSEEEESKEEENHNHDTTLEDFFNDL